MQGQLVADEMGLGKTFTSVAAAMICKLLTEKVVMGLLLSFVWGNTVEECVNMAHNDYPGLIGEEQEWYSPQSLYSVPCRLLEIQTTPPLGHLALPLAREPILVVRIPGVAGPFNSVIHAMRYGTDFNLVNVLHAENVDITNEDLNASFDEP